MINHAAEHTAFIRRLRREQYDQLESINGQVLKNPKPLYEQEEVELRNNLISQLRTRRVRAATRNPIKKPMDLILQDR
jgi:hypothetical protein